LICWQIYFVYLEMLIELIFVYRFCSNNRDINQKQSLFGKYFKQDTIDIVAIWE
jgi:hypothetical protein